MQVTVTTPTGNIGSKLIPLLLDRGATVTVVARHPEKLKDLASRGVKIVKGEHSDPAVLKQALAGSDALFFLIPPPYTSHDPVGEYRNFADAAARTIAHAPDVHVVLLSSVGAHRPDGTGLIKGLHAAEQLLAPAAKNFTAVRANYFMENLLGSLPTILQDGNIYSTVSGARSMPQVATTDIASITAKLILAGPTGHRLVDVAGPQEVTFEDVARAAGDAIGKPVQHVVIPPDALQAAVLQAGFSPEVAREFVEMQHALEHNMGTELVGDEQRRGTTTIRQFVRDVFLPAYQQAKRGAAA
jgi:uncharacterized protein YbjT (DUF2867 family)